MLNVKTLLKKMLSSMPMAAPEEITLPYTAQTDGLLIEGHRTNGSGNSYVQVRIGEQDYVGQAQSGWSATHIFPVRKGDTITQVSQNSATGIGYKFIKWGGVVSRLLQAISNLIREEVVVC